MFMSSPTMNGRDLSEAVWLSSAGSKYLGDRLPNPGQPLLLAVSSFQVILLFAFPGFLAKARREGRQ